MAFERFADRPGNKASAIQELNHCEDQIGIALTDPDIPLAEKARKLERFHYQVAVFSGSQALPFVLNSIQSAAEIVWGTYIQMTPPEDLINSLDGIIKALALNNSARAYAILKTSFENITG